MMFFPVRGYLTSLAFSYGYLFSRTSIVPNQPDDSSYFYNLDYTHTHIIRASIDYNLLTYRGRSIKDTKADPYLFALESALLCKNKRMFIDEFVRTISSFVHPGRTAAEALHLPSRGDLRDLPEWCSVLPWENLTVDKKKYTLVSNYHSKRLDILSRFLYSEDDINLYDTRFWLYNAKQCYALKSSITKHGFYDHSLPVVNVMLNDGSYKLMMSCSGNKRMMCASLLGLRDVSVRIGNIIDLARISCWPNVANGYYSVAEAKKIFLDYFTMAGYGSYI